MQTTQHVTDSYRIDGLAPFLTGIFPFLVILFLVSLAIIMIFRIFSSNLPSFRHSREKYFIIALLIINLFLFNTSNVQATSRIVSSSPLVYNQPVTEELNLLINGTGGVWVNVSKQFDYILAMTIHLEFTSSTLAFDEFGSDAALTNGFAYYYNNINLLDNDFIQANHELGHQDGNLEIFSDSTAPKHYSFYDNILFTTWVSDGLEMLNNKSFGFLIQDDMPTETSVEILIATIRGYVLNTSDVVPYFSTPNNRTDYFPNGLTTLSIHNLVIDASYQIKFNTSSSDNTEKWFNFTAKQEILEYKFQFELHTYQPLLNIYVYRNNSYVAFTQLFTVQNSDSSNWNLLIQYIPLFVIAGAAIVLYVFFKH